MWTQKEQDFLDRHKDEIEKVKLDTLFYLLEKAESEVGGEFYYKLAFALSYLIGGPKVFIKKITSVSNDTNQAGISFFIRTDEGDLPLAKFFINIDKVPLEAKDLERFDRVLIERLTPEIEFEKMLKEVVSNIEWR